ncbi:PIN domain nuclease of toxin-antitoxin system [Herbihabitans rhizosphaerae]|uniref:PIN domain nuclease of toxin-antitoxin system n=1 Tax=Herbihabitans rhizosphaerae TaxID=1872711 RepID=A0A4Q7KDV8_9PSEU|nr:type II toxin-antitoxin system VapC family toxin [Herbihabitans rhizosphaerae]RZS32424.1 PIN domain nuclease of toxin-antitoxin system [Herbihabitans rhizosphaerae]
MNVFDASALLAFLRGEEGADEIERALDAGGVCGAANWSEVIQVLIRHGRDWELSVALLQSYGLDVLPVSGEDGEWAARRWRRGESLSLGDRLCLALGERMDATVWTADKEWGDGGRVRQIR